MKVFSKRNTPVYVGILATPLLLFWAIAETAGVGHDGHYGIAVLLFAPAFGVTGIANIVWIRAVDRAGIPTLILLSAALVLAFVQYPLYGAVIGRILDKKLSFWWLAGLLAIHALIGTWILLS
ncbi:MAG TPA: hypothetical protein VFD58_28055 [Blastocatellia bacterium]|nr:hypothetical protein [Blastocatellia bacterium]